ncbi:HD domain-containing protein [Patescibacteria group bacterium]|nr:HD domain-containing protein [Candidatus Falkowbacteria bacterium]MBU3905477.1 HD domain-containing protein [Patescibacteria group bacterium]MCG2698518.1 HD domain-containing protein [Candidatus Parcubacteria bacterium]MBU4015291.1 HD domain-containing protein [Patescibacteria group bacterium]MBU4026045.1 HD domain-containing protein [Patescibacteria group bacterium]
MKKQIKFYNFINFLDKLKDEKRYAGVRHMRGDNSADHSWRLAVIVMLASEFYNIKINLLKAVKIALVHDLVEIYAKDIPRSDRFKKNITKKYKLKNEKIAMVKIKKLAPASIGKEINDLWAEYTKLKTKEAKIVASLDKIEGLMTFFNRGKPSKYGSEYIATYSNKYILKTPELAPLYKVLQSEMKKSYKKNRIEWKKEYNIQ